MFPLDPRQSYGGDVVSFAKWVELEYRKKYLTYFDIIDYFQLIQKLEDTFGAPNILVLPLELLNFDKALFIRRFSKFCDIDAVELTELLLNPKNENEGVSAGQNLVRKLSIRHPKLAKAIKLTTPDPLKLALKQLLFSRKTEEIHMSEDLDVFSNENTHPGTKKLLEN